MPNSRSEVSRERKRGRENNSLERRVSRLLEREARKRRDRRNGNEEMQMGIRRLLQAWDSSCRFLFRFYLVHSLHSHCILALFFFYRTSCSRRPNKRASFLRLTSIARSVQRVSCVCSLKELDVTQMIRKNRLNIVHFNEHRFESSSAPLILRPTPLSESTTTSCCINRLRISLTPKVPQSFRESSTFTPSAVDREALCHDNPILACSGGK